MRLLMRCLWKARWFVAIIIVLLAINATANLALPSFTSRIVNVGIQQEGIEKALFERIGLPTYALISATLETSEATEFTQAYQIEGSSYRLIGNSDRQRLEHLTVKAFATITGLPLELASQAAIAAIAAEYRTLGIDVDAMRLRFIASAGLTMLGVAFAAIGASVAVSFFAAKTAATIGRSLRAQVFDKVLSFSRPEMDGFSTASLITRSTNDIQQIQMSSVMLMRIVFFAPMMAIGGLLRVLGTETSLAWVVGIGVAIIIVSVSLLFIVAMPRFKRLQLLIDRINLVMRERLSGLQVIRAFGTGGHEQRRFDTANRELTATSLFVNRAMSAMMPLMMLVMNLVIVLILWNGSHRIESGSMQVGDMMAFMQYGIQILMSFLMLTMLTIMLPRAAVAGDRIAEVLETDLTIKDLPSDERTQAALVSQEYGTVRFEHVGFSYPGASTEALHDISFSATPQTVTAIIGSTGCGKSTLLNLIVRFYDADSGSVLVEGRDVRTMPLAELRSRIAYVPQKAVLFSGTVASNIEFGHKEESEKRIDTERAARIAQADGFIKEMSDGYSSPISQGGSNVSGGQRQRLAIARAIATARPILLFDDSFSALDYRTDSELRKALQTELAGSTVIIVAQRISTIVHADRILVLEDGCIVGDGTHRQLLETCRVYRQIAASQLSEEELEA